MSSVWVVKSNTKPYVGIPYVAVFDSEAKAQRCKNEIDKDWPSELTEVYEQPVNDVNRLLTHERDRFINE